MPAPDLLDDDGRASIATAVMISHHGLRRDLARFRGALAAVTPGDRAREEALAGEWQRYRTVLHGHHDAEDQRMFPHLRTQAPQLTAVIDRLSADHRRIDPLLERADRAFAGAALGEAAAALAELAVLLEPHLAIEEAEIIPLLREAREFPPPATPEEADLFAEGFAWGSHGIAPEVLAQLDGMLPQVILARLPAARAAFEARARQVWGSSPPGRSTTAIPDWLTAP